MTELSHIVCHCTEDNVSACGIDCTDDAWVDPEDEHPCPLCELAWPYEALACPWGCACGECGQPEVLGGAA
jgi:hypothetical protein